MLHNSWIARLFPQHSRRISRRGLRTRGTHLTRIEHLELRALLTEVGVPGIMVDGLKGTEDTPIIANLITGTNGATADQFDGPVTLASVTQPTHGSVTFLPDGTITYTPIADYFGNDKFTYTVATETGTETANVFIKLTGEIDIHNDIFITNTGVPLTGNLLNPGGLHHEFEGTPVVVSVSQAQYGAVTFLPDGTVTYSPTVVMTGLDTFTYTVESGGVTETAKVSVFVNAPEFLVPDSLITGMNTPITANVILGTGGASADMISGIPFPYLYRITPAQHGTVTFLECGTGFARRTECDKKSMELFVFAI